MTNFVLNAQESRERNRETGERWHHTEKAAIWVSRSFRTSSQEGRFCENGDYKVTANQAIKCDTYLISHIEDLFAAMAGGTCFTKLDLSHAYLQLELDESSRNCYNDQHTQGVIQVCQTAILECLQRLRTMENLLKGIENILIYIDDILITGQTGEAHLRKLNKVLRRVEKAGMW